MLFNYTMFHMPTGKVFEKTGKFLSETQALRFINFWNKSVDYKYTLGTGQGDMKNIIDYSYEADKGKVAGYN